MKYGRSEINYAYDIMNHFFFNKSANWSHVGFGIFATYELHGEVISCMGNWDHNWRYIDFATAAKTADNYYVDSRNYLLHVNKNSGAKFDENTVATFNFFYYNSIGRGVIYESSAGRATYLPDVFPNVRSAKVQNLLRQKAGVNGPQINEKFIYYDTYKYSMSFKDFMYIWGKKKIATIPPNYMANNDVHIASNLWHLYKWGKIPRPNFISNNTQALAFIYKYNPDPIIRKKLEKALLHAGNILEYVEICWSLGYLPKMSNYENNPFIWSWYTKCGHKISQNFDLKYYNEKAVVFEVTQDFNLFIDLARAGDNVRTDLLYHFLNGF